MTSYLNDRSYSENEETRLDHSQSSTSRLRRSRVWPIAASLLLLFSSSTCFAQFGFGVTGALEYLDNPLRLPDSDDQDLDRSLAIDASYVAETERLLTNLSYSASKHDYENDILDDRDLIEGSSQFTLQILPELLQWDLSNLRTNQLIDAAQPDMFNNRQVMSSTSTGPALSFPFGGANFVNLQLNHTITSFEQTDSVNQNQTALSANLTRVLSSRLRASIRSNYTEIDFNSSFFPNLEILSVSIQAAFTAASYDVTLEVGEYETKRVGSGGSRNPLIQLDALYRINTQTEVTATYAKRVQDPMSDIRNSQTQLGFQGSQDVGFQERFGSSNLGNVFEQESKGVNFSYTSESQYSLSLRYASELRATQGVVGDTNIDESIALNLLVPLGSRLSFAFQARISELDFERRNSLQERNEIGVTASYRLNEQLSFRFQLSSIDQESNLAIDSSEGMNALFSVTYRR